MIEYLIFAWPRCRLRHVLLREYLARGAMGRNSMRLRGGWNHESNA
jgi:hypothetical protein